MIRFDERKIVKLYCSFEDCDEHIELEQLPMRCFADMTVRLDISSLVDLLEVYDWAAGAVVPSQSIVMPGKEDTTKVVPDPVCFCPTHATRMRETTHERTREP